MMPYREWRRPQNRVVPLLLLLKEWNASGEVTFLVCCAYYVHLWVDLVVLDAFFFSFSCFFIFPFFCDWYYDGGFNQI